MPCPDPEFVKINESAHFGSTNCKIEIFSMSAKMDTSRQITPKESERHRNFCEPVPKPCMKKKKIKQSLRAKLSNFVAKQYSAYLNAGKDVNVVVTMSSKKVHNFIPQTTTDIIIQEKFKQVKANPVKPATNRPTITQTVRNVVLPKSKAPTTRQDFLRQSLSQIEETAPPLTKAVNPRQAFLRTPFAEISEPVPAKSLLFKKHHPNLPKHTRNVSFERSPSPPLKAQSPK